MPTIKREMYAKQAIRKIVQELSFPTAQVYFPISY